MLRGQMPAYKNNAGTASAMMKVNSVPVGTVVPTTGNVPMGIAPGLAGTPNTVVQYVPAPNVVKAAAAAKNNELSEENANAYPVNLNKLNVNGKEYPSSYLKEMGRYMTPNRPTKDPLGGYGKLPWGVPPMAPRNILQSAERRIRHPDMKNKTRRGRHARQATRKNTRRNSRASRKIRMNRR